MTPAERAALRKRVEGDIEFDDYFHENGFYGLSRKEREARDDFYTAAREALPELLDDCDRLEHTVELQRAVIAENDADAKRLTRERDDARAIIRGALPNHTTLFAKWDAEDAQAAKKDEFNRRLAAGEHCHSASDGDCDHASCPQLRDGEPAKTGRHCPLDHWGPDDEGRAGG